MAQEADTLWSGHANSALHPSAFLRGGRLLLVSCTSPGANDDWSDPRFTMGAASGRSTEASAAQLAQGLWGWVFDDPTPPMMRWGLVMGAYVKDENSPEVYLVESNGLVYQGAMPVCHPAVNVPAGYLSAFPKTP